MLVPARIFAIKKILDEMDEGVIEQLTNVACLPGIQKYAMCMPDGHWGYGFPIGGVAAFDVDNGGIISPGGIGFDINCGMRLIRTNLTLEDFGKDEESQREKVKELVNLLFTRVPAGVGCKGFLDLKKREFDEVLVQGAKWIVEKGYGVPEDVDHIEANGQIKEADPGHVSQRAIKRGLKQLGTLGSGNHYLEIQVVKDENIFDDELAKAWGIFGKNQICIMVHCGSRGFGHQIGTDYLKKFLKIMPDYGIKIRDKELACAPFDSKEGQAYFAAMACAANMAFANRQVITHRIRECFEEIFQKPSQKMEMDLIYDVAHNIAKLETYEGKRLLVHRKGATRSFGPNNPELEPEFQETGQPVILGGSMETGSYLLVGTKEAEELSFGSTAHGSGRRMSRHKAKKEVHGDQLQRDMEQRGIYVKTASYSGLAEEAGLAYKNIDEVVQSLELSKLSKPVCRLIPIGNIKG